MTNAKHWIGGLAALALVVGSLGGVEVKAETPATAPPSARPTDQNRVAAWKAQDEAFQLTRQKAPRKEIIAKYKEALKYWRLAGDKRKEYLVLSNIAHEYQQRGEFPQFLKYAQLSLFVAQAPHERTLALSSISLAYIALGEYEKNAKISKSRIFESNDPESILLGVLNLAATYYNLGDKSKALDTFDQFIAYWNQKQEPIRQAEALEGLSYQYFKLGEHNKGLELVKQVNRLDPQRKRNPIILDQGVALSIGQVCTKQLEPFSILPKESQAKTEDLPARSESNYIQENRRVIEQFQERIKIVRAGEKISLEAGMLTGLALTHSTLGESQTALDYYRQAFKLDAVTGQRPRQANTLRAIANLLGQQGKYQEAINYLNQSLEFQRILKDLFDQGVTIKDIGVIYETLADYDASISAYQQALAIFKKIGDRRREADTILKIGSIYRQQKNYSLALQQFEQALIVAQQSGNCLVTSNVYRHMSRTYEDAGDPTKSYEYGNLALTFAQNLSDFPFKPASIANALNLMARAKTKAGDYGASLELSRRSQEITRQANLQWANTSVYDVIANAYEASKQYDQAIETFQEKLALVRSLGQYSEEAYIFYFLAKMECQKGNLPTALKHIDSALDVIENIRQDLLSPDLRTRFFSTKQNYYALKINILT